MARKRPDCDVVLPPGPEPRIDPDNPPPHDVASMSSWIRQVRGGFLAGGFYIEQNIDAAIESFFLGPIAQSDDPRSHILEEQFLGSLTLERKVNLLCSIVARLLPEGLAPLRKQLGEFRTIRNTLAHNPCWFEANVDQERYLRSLRPMIHHGKQPVEITRKRLDGWNSLVRELITTTGEIAGWLRDPQNNRPFEDSHSVTPGLHRPQGRPVPAQSRQHR